MKNPLLEMEALPPFQSIQPEHMEEAITAIIAEARDTIEELLKATDNMLGITLYNL